MKRKNRLLALVLAVATVIFALASCGKAAEGDITVVIAGESTVEYEVSLEKIKVTRGLVSVLEHLNETEGISFEMNGTMIEKVGELENDNATATYIFIYTSVERDFDVSQWKTTVEYNGEVLTSSGVGASDMTLADGAVIYITTVTYD